MRLCRGFSCGSCSWSESLTCQLSFDAVLPLILQPILIVLASQHEYSTVLVFVMTPLLICYLYRNFLRFLMRTRFFLMWTYTSVLMFLLIYELMVVPLLEILPEENLIFIVFVLGGVGCAYKTRCNAVQGSQETVPGLELGEGSGNMCDICKRRVPSKAFHCRICQTCVFRREYHCKWLDCCIGLTNLSWYLACLSLSSAAFMYGSNLTLTTICHPFKFMGPILLPDDCSDVYSQLDTAICFVSSVYSLLIGLVMLWYLAYHIWLIYLGTTTYERRLYKNENHYGQGLLENIRYLLCCKSPYFSHLSSSQYTYQR